MAIPSTQIHVLVGCSDARDVGRVHLEVVEQVRKEYLARGVRSELFVLRTLSTPTRSLPSRVSAPHPPQSSTGWGQTSPTQSLAAGRAQNT
jgi:hypothetical protein